MSAWPETQEEVEALRAAWQRGDWDTLTPRLLAIGAHCLRGSSLSDDERDDLIARALMRAWSQDEAPEHPAAWLFRVLRNAALDDAKHARFAARFDGDLPSAQPAPDAALIDAEEHDRVLAQLRVALRGLPDALRRCVVLRYLHHRSHAEIAQQLHISQSAVKGRIHRGLSALRAWYAPDALTHPMYRNLHTRAHLDAAGMT